MNTCVAATCHRSPRGSPAPGPLIPDLSPRQPVEPRIKADRELQERLPVPALNRQVFGRHNGEIWDGETLPGGGMQGEECGGRPGRAVTTSHTDPNLLASPPVQSCVWLSAPVFSQLFMTSEMLPL